jgi:outer membrane receptor protein involved in Fe transport
VTAVAKGPKPPDAAISISALNGARSSRPRRAVAEIFRNIPGLRSESSGGEGNANIAVRGLPVASGGSKFLQIQEDGLPVLEYGDITFGTVDMFVRADLNLERVEALRGGSASTFASNSPGGVINMISQTGEVEGGQIQVQTGLDYGENRVDVSYGGHAGEQTRYHFGGFYRAGTGPRAAGYDGNRGGQIKANVTREFTGGYIRIIGKYLDDRAIAYLPNPVRVSGAMAIPAMPTSPISRSTRIRCIPAISPAT